MNWAAHHPFFAADRTGTTWPVGRSGESPHIEVSVVFTTWQDTMAALRMADRLSRSLEARIVLWHFQAITRHFTMSSPPISTQFLKHRLAAMIRKCCRMSESEIRICFCSNWEQCLRTAFAPEDVVIVGGRKRWWPSLEQRTATILKSRGCRVLLCTDEPDLGLKHIRKEP
jgi:hypothetical protein